VRSPFIALTQTNVDRRLSQILDRLAHGPLDEELQRRAIALLADPDPPDIDALKTSLTAFRWFLDRAAEDDIPLTAAGLRALELLRNVGGEPADPFARWRVSPVAAQLAHAALQRG
jgi:hypothetical protein